MAAPSPLATPIPAPIPSLPLSRTANSRPIKTMYHPNVHFTITYASLTSQSACLGTLVDSYCQKKRSGGVLQYNVYCGNNIEAPTKTHTHTRMLHQLVPESNKREQQIKRIHLIKVSRYRLFLKAKKEK